MKKILRELPGKYFPTLSLLQSVNQLPKQAETVVRIYKDFIPRVLLFQGGRHMRTLCIGSMRRFLRWECILGRHEPLVSDEMRGTQ